MKTETQISAGGVAVRGSKKNPEAVLISVGQPYRWQLPKGLIDKAESPEAAAIREVMEEAGVEAQILREIKTVEYWYVASHSSEKIRYHKFVHFFLMKYLSGDVTKHDHEVNEARWVNMRDAGEMLAFKSEKEVMTLAIELLAAG
jgi:8-oxo-dGTP pyrophosphatase MutT (NUDIX family)